LKNLLKFDKTKLYFNNENLDISKVIVKETEYQNNWLSSILIAATSIGGALLLK